MKAEQQQSQNPIFTDLLSISSQIRKILLQKRKRKILKCGYLVFLVGFIFLYEILYVINDCYLEVYSYYQIVIISLFFIDFYMETIYIKIINQYIDIFKWERSDNNEEKYRQLKNNKVRQIIYKLVSKNQGDILPLTMVHHRKMIVGAFVLVFFTQFYFTTNYEDFECFFQYEPTIMNMVFWMMYISMIIFRKLQCFNSCCLNSKDTKLGNSMTSFNITSSQCSNLSVEQLEEEWKLRSTSEKVVYWKKQSNSSEKIVSPNEVSKLKEEKCVAGEQCKIDKCDEVMQLQENDQVEQNKSKGSQIIQDIFTSNLEQIKTKPYQKVGDFDKNNNNQLSSETNKLKIESDQVIIEIQESAYNKEDQYKCEGEDKIFENTDVEACQICLIELQDGEIGREMKCCKKIFHKECCLQWFNTKETCPNCRSLPVISF